jgi:hypothetical protein
MESVAVDLLAHEFNADDGKNVFVCPFSGF